jgi:putative NADH-flavin reductase
MIILIVGATGATERLLTKELLERGETVKVIVR